MNQADIRKTVLQALSAIAPEVDASSIDEKQPLRDSLDLDSMDFLNLVVALGRELRVDIPERDYPQLQTLGSIVQYLGERAAPRTAEPGGAR